MIINSGADLTDFGSVKNWQKFVNEMGLNYVGRGKNILHGLALDQFDDRPFLWRNGAGLTMATGNNPETGEWRSAGRRRPEVGYASYVGVCGPREEISRWKKAMKKYAVDIKSGNLFSDDYIGVE